MNNRFIRNLTILMAALCLSGTWCMGQSGQRKALLVGIGNYPAEGGWGSLSSLNDLGLVERALRERGFSKEHILVLTDASATRSGIEEAITGRFLQMLSRGDIAYIHFSGHGQQMIDRNGDEVDGYDECLVPYDSPKKYVEGVYEGERLLTDDELGEMLRRLRAKLGETGHLVVAVDACHSGTGTRGLARTRGSHELMAPQSYIRDNAGRHFAKSDRNAIRGEHSGAENESLASMVALFGSAQNQLNCEMTDDKGDSYGSLSYAFAQQILQVNQRMTYRGLFDRIRLEMGKLAPNQQPQAEGELDMEVFDGKLHERATYYRTLGIAGPKALRMNGGSLHGIHRGTKVTLFPPETRNPDQEQPIASGLVTQSYATESVVAIDSTLPEPLVLGAWIYVTEHSLGDLQLRLGIRSRPDLEEPEFIPALFTKPYLLRDDRDPEIWLEQSQGSHPSDAQWKLKSRDGYVLDSSPASRAASTIQHRFLKSVRDYLRGKFLKRLELVSEEVAVSFKLIPADSVVDGKSIDSLPGFPADRDGVVRLPVGTVLRILLRNQGIRPAYFSLIDLQPDNKDNILLPDPATPPEEMRILPGQSILLRTSFVIGEPLGQEMFRLVASSKPFDLRLSLGVRGAVKPDPFEQFFLELKEDHFMQSRGGAPLRLPHADMNIYTQTFVITN
ncbi:MAG: caspase family protein [Saprospiraceae bacterium]|nr:caspase family protein [Saprospiraceae bacterium]